MLNRTTRTLSAHLNRLNLLGTRSLAPVANVNKGAQTLHARHASTVVMRAGTVGRSRYPIPIGTIGIPSIPGSASVSSWLGASCEVHPRVDFDTQFVVDGVRPVVRTTLACLPDEEPGVTPRRLRAGQGQGQADRQPLAGQRWQAAKRPAGAWKRAILSPVPASVAAAGG
jgi:hypothetical protein